MDKGRGRWEVMVIGRVSVGWRESSGMQVAAGQGGVGPVT